MAMNGQAKTPASNRLVAICCSTGGPKALQEVIPLLPEDFPAPILIVQHMPHGFTHSLANRLDHLSKVTVTEAVDGEEIMPGHAYIAKGGLHMKARKQGNKHRIVYTHEPIRQGVKPCADYMYESLMDTDYDGILCVVMTGMGKDGTEGITNLIEKKKTSVIVQDQASSIVFGMPGSILKKDIPCEVVTLKEISKAIINKMEVQ